MAKPDSGTRTLRPTSNTVDENYKIYLHETMQSDVDVSNCYFSNTTGGYAIAMKGHNYSEEEKEVMRHLADSGFVVVATPEGGKTWVSASYTNKKGETINVYADGLIMGNSYEQSTKKPVGSTDKELAKSVDGALQHANAKGASIPLIYDRYGKFHRNNIEDGIEKFEKHSMHRFKAIIVVDKHGNVYEHQHNK